MPLNQLIAQGGRNIKSPVQRYLDTQKQMELEKRNQLAMQSTRQDMDMQRRQQQRQDQAFNIKQGQEFAAEAYPLLKTVNDADNPKVAYEVIRPQLNELRQRYRLPLDEDSVWNQQVYDALENRLGGEKFETVVIGGNPVQVSKASGKETESPRGGKTGRRDAYYAPITGKGGKTVMVNTRDPSDIVDIDVTSARYDPETLRNAEYAKKFGKDAASLRVIAINDLPQMEASAEQSIGYIEKLVKHPGMKDVIGLPDNPLGLKGYMWGSDAADFKARLDQLTGRNFMLVFPTLKGGGQITETEGEKATNAISRMRSATSEKAFLKASSDLVSEINILKNIVKERAGVKSRTVKSYADPEKEKRYQQWVREQESVRD